eukprot:TRINITY_DN122998_c0_g1_i1.p1 TRINITY_DN122998_c0_g1~~TRINITY_DN122998_c0_g1_i1.p1  ORF type:complete len:556 (-),score=152.06 TRINITY_DN122998_c0_g1_i1:360-2027(-)
MKAALVAALLAEAALASNWEADLKRARTWVPRSGFKGKGSLASANAQLNRHLAFKKGLKVKACEDFSVPELRELLQSVFPHTAEDLKNVYSDKDGRRSVYSTLEEMLEHWAEVPADDHRVRDAHCHEAVMWFIHHLTSEKQEELKQALVLPLLPVADHTHEQKSRLESDKAGKFYDAKVTCQACHVGGIDNLGLPEVAPETAKAKSRRCYTNYKELYNITCEPCDGVAGPYSGDDDKYFTPTECVVVAKPEEVPEAQRVKPHLPPQFKVDVVGGSDRFGRTTNPVHDQLPGPVAKIYGQIYGQWYMDAKADADVWMLRHDTTYASVTENGFPIPFIKPHVSEIHAQTAKQRASNLTGPMVSLIQGMPSFIPGGCTCIPDPVGVPDITASAAKGLGEMQYMGRIRLPKLEYLDTPIELDHWASWFFHIFMDTNTSMPHYAKAPSRLASAYAGTAVYNNWVMEDPAIKDPTVWYRGIPTKPMAVGPDRGQYCMNANKVDFCANISQATFPPKPAAEHGQPAAGHGGEARLPFFPQAAHLADHIAQYISQQKPAEIVV